MHHRVLSDALSCHTSLGVKRLNNECGFILFSDCSEILWKRSECMLRSLLIEERYLPFLLFCNSGFNTVQLCSWSIQSNLPIADSDQKKCLLTGIALRALVDCRAFTVMLNQLGLLGSASVSCLHVWPKTPVLQCIWNTAFNYVIQCYCKLVGPEKFNTWKTLSVVKAAGSFK